MKITLIVIVVLAIVLVVWCCAFWWLPIKKTRMDISERRVTVWVLDNERARSRGLQWIIWLPKNSGAFFKFGYPANHCFWNKNTFLPLRLIFLNNGKVVEEHYLPALWRGRKTICAAQFIDGVIEIPYH